MTEIKPIHPLENGTGQDIDSSFSCYQEIKEAKIRAKNNLQLLASLYYSTKNLCSALERLDILMESVFFCNEREKEK